MPTLPVEWQHAARIRTGLPAWIAPRLYECTHVGPKLVQPVVSATMRSVPPAADAPAARTAAVNNAARRDLAIRCLIGLPGGGLNQAEEGAPGRGRALRF